jgi:chloramphenicol-sensitive protein RarD
VSADQAGLAGEARSGVGYGLLAYTMWGLFPIYFVWTASVAPLEVLGHRILWAVPFGALIITFRRQWREVGGALLDRSKLSWLALAAVSITVNWLTYIWAIQHERIFETSLGYYINPLIYVAVGVLFFGERLRRLQGIAVGLAAVGVLILTVSGDAFPWVALVLGTSFTLYGVIRKQVAIGAMPGLFIETLMLLPFALLWISWLVAQGGAAITAGDSWLTMLLILGGPMTVLPLMFFALAARRLPLTIIGFMQFLAPSVQFMIGVYYGEPLTVPHIVCFSCIWAAVVAFSYDALRPGRKKPLPA